MLVEVIGDLLQAVLACIELDHLVPGATPLSRLSASFTRASTNTTLWPGTATGLAAGVASAWPWVSLLATG
jgi:hypothetical protein